MRVNPDFLSNIKAKLIFVQYRIYAKYLGTLGRSNVYCMDKEVTEILKHISETLDAVLETISKPQSKAAQIFSIGASIVTILGLVAIVDVLISWLKS